MSLTIARNTLRARPLCLGYRPLLSASTHSIRPSSSIRYVVPTNSARAFSTSFIRFNQELNTKTTTTVAPVEKTEEKPAPTSRIGKFIQQSKDLVKFYKDGLKLLWNNNKQAKALLLKVKNEGYELNRSEFQLVHQSKKDMIKLIPFGFVFCILPESIPLIVMFIPGMVPGTCLKDHQIQKQREKLDAVRQKMTMNVLKSAEQVEGISPEDFLSLSKFQKISKSYSYDFDLNRIDRRHLSSYCRFMGINDYGTQWILKRRLAKYMNYLNEDDKLLVKDDVVDNLSVKELSHAVEERGMRSVNEGVENMRRGLKYWLSLTQPANPDQVIPPGLLVFSRMFLLNAKYQGSK